MKKSVIALTVALLFQNHAYANEFTNGGFEAGTKNSWTEGGGLWQSGSAPLNPDLYDPTGASYNATYMTNTIVTRGYDEVLAPLGINLNRVYDGNYAVRVNDSNNDWSVSTISQTVTNYGSSSINFAWAAVMDGGHPASSASHFVITIMDVTNPNAPVQVGNNIVYTAGSGATTPPFSNTVTFNSVTSGYHTYYYTNGWISQSVAVTQGRDYKLTLLASDCNAGGHWGYVYLDAFSLYPVASRGLGPSLEDTLLSLQDSSRSLRGAFNQQAAVLNNSLTYDCTTFDSKGICLSGGGRVTDVNNPSTNSQGALLIAAYRPNPNWRVGAFLDQNLSSNDARGVNLENGNPMFGLFSVWNQNLDGTGYQVRLSAGYGDRDVTVSRGVIGGSEAGKGDSSLRSQAFSASVSRGFRLNDSRWIASPYLGVRYSKIKRAGYTEDSSADVTAPLTYSGLSQETTTALAGVRFNGQLAEKVNVMVSAGVESDIAHNTGDYAATGVSDLTPIAFNQNVRHVRPVAQAGVSYAIDKRQTITANLLYRQEAFNSSNSTTGMVTYQVGF